MYWSRLCSGRSIIRWTSNGSFVTLRSDRITGGLGRDIHRGGPGADHLASRDGGPDSVDGGPGADSARIDRPYDRLTNVEST